MTTVQLSRRAGVWCCALGCVAALATPGGAAFITSPQGPGGVGNGQSTSLFAGVTNSSSTDTNGNRYQQVYSSEFFAPVGAAQSISSVAFRPKQGAFGSFIGSTIELSNVIVRLSTTPRNADTDFPNGLSGDLATNPGADARTVYSGALTLRTNRTLFDSGVAGFDFVITFQNVFSYRPGAGNLLLEIITPAGAIVTSRTATGGMANFFPAVDSFTDAFPSLDGTASAVDADLTDGSSVGSNSTTGLVTQFVTVATPGPATLTLMAGAATTLFVAARRRV